MSRFNCSFKISLPSLKCFLLAISPILHMYRFVAIVTWGDVALVSVTLLTLMSRRQYNSQSQIVKNIILLILYLGLSTFIGTLLWQGPLFDAVKEYIVFSVYYVIALLLIQKTDLDLLCSIYKKVVIFTACFVIIQFLAQLLFGISISGLIPHVTTYFGNSTNYYISKASNRGAGFFTEPAMCARFMAVAFILYVADAIKENKNIVNLHTIILTTALLFTLSGNAIASLIIGYGGYMFCTLKKGTLKETLRSIVLAISCVVLVILLYRQPIFRRLFSRVSEVTNTNDTAFKSGYIRIIQGFVAYFNLPFPGMILGIGFGNYKTVVDTYLWDILATTTDMLPYWINGIQEYCIYGGLIGVILFGNLLCCFWKRGNQQQKLVLLLFLVFLFMSGLACSPLWVIFMVIIGSKASSKTRKAE